VRYNWLEGISRPNGWWYRVAGAGVPARRESPRFQPSGAPLRYAPATPLLVLKCPLLVFLVLAVCAGCDSGPKTVPVAGEVTFDGQPVQKGSILFIPVDETPGRSTGASITDGRYSISKEGGPLAGGTYAVRIFAMRKSGKKIADPMSLSGELTEIEENYIPAAYNSRTTLKLVISESPLDFRLEKMPAAGAPTTLPGNRKGG